MTQVTDHFRGAVARPSSITRTARSAGVAPRSSARLLPEGQLIASPHANLRYRIGRFLGQGGFGQVYLATRLGQSTEVPEEICLKVSEHMDGWLREAYFGLLLNDHPRAVRVFDRFPFLPPDRPRRGYDESAEASAKAVGRNHQTADPPSSSQRPVLYCLVLEYARHGDLSAYLARNQKGWSEAATRREIAGVLEVLRKLHRGHLLHRDLTPMNVFVCDNNRLKLGDFGIVRQQSDARGVTARTRNAMTAPSDILDGTAPKWQARDDVYQVGQLLAMLVKGDAGRRVRTADVRRLTCSDHLKEIVHRCIGERRKRYESADELIEAIRNPPAALKPGVLRSLKDVHLAFTGFLSRPRAEAVRAARRAGAIVHGGPSARTTVVVRGRPNPLQAAGKDGGIKLMEIKRLREKGHRITLLNETQFWRLASHR